MILPSDKLKELDEGKVLEQPIKVFDFATIVSDKKLTGSGLERGDEVFVMSTKDVAFKKNDPWLKRTLFIVAKVVNNIPQIPKPNEDEVMAYVVDPRNLQRIVGDRDVQLKESFNNRSV